MLLWDKENMCDVIARRDGAATRQSRAKREDSGLLRFRWSFAMTVLCALFLTACGFQPMYGELGAQKDVSVTAALNDIYIANIPEWEGQYLRNELIDRMYKGGAPADPHYTLKLKPVKERITDLDITKTADATRAQLRLESKMALVDNTTGKAVLSRDLLALTSFNVLEGRFTTRVSERAARENALNDLARQVELQLTLYFKRMP